MPTCHRSPRSWRWWPLRRSPPAAVLLPADRLDEATALALGTGESQRSGPRRRRDGRGRLAGGSLAGHRGGAGAGPIADGRDSHTPWDVGELSWWASRGGIQLSHNGSGRTPVPADDRRSLDRGGRRCGSSSARGGGRRSAGPMPPTWSPPGLGRATWSGWAPYAVRDRILRDRRGRRPAGPAWTSRTSAGSAGRRTPVGPRDGRVAAPGRRAHRRPDRRAALPLTADRRSPRLVVAAQAGRTDPGPGRRGCPTSGARRANIGSSPDVFRPAIRCPGGARPPGPRRTEGTVGCRFSWTCTTWVGRSPSTTWPRRTPLTWRSRGTTTSTTCATG